jgi:hypothetical protein
MAGRGAHVLLVMLAILLVTGAASAQYPRIGVIDFYGLRSLKPADLAGALRLQIGDTLTVSDVVLRHRLLEVPGVRDVEVSAVCCEAGRTILYVGIRETGSDVVEFDAAPNGDARLPPDIIQAANDFGEKVFEGVRQGKNEQDDSAGHAVMLYPPARAVQQILIDYAVSHVPETRVVLRDARDANHRAVAAQILAYAKDKAAVVSDLVAATRDPNGDVRNNALRALAVMAVYEQKHPDAGLHVPYEPFIELLNSLAWTDRNKSSMALAALTQPRAPQLIALLRARAMDSLVEMARWQAFGHAAAAGIILGRIAGLPEEQIFPMLQKNREGLITAALRP